MQKRFNQNHQLAFVVYLLAQGKLSQDVAVSLQNWADSYFPDFKAVKQEISEKIQLTSHKDTDEPRLWIILNQGSTSDSYCIETAHFIQNLKNYQSGAEPDFIFTVNHSEMLKIDLNEKMAPILTSIRQQIPNTITNLLIEVFLPFKALDLAPDQWLLEDEYAEEALPLGSEFPVVLRILERVPGYGNGYLQQGFWQDKWKKRHLQKSCREVLICTKSNNDEIITALSNFIASGIYSPYPPSEHQSKPKPNTLVMREGIPFWLWLRKPLDSCTEPTVFEEKLLTEETLQTLPQRLKAIRNDALNDPNHLAAHISFLVDNPEKMPYKQTSQPQLFAHT